MLKNKHNDLLIDSENILYMNWAGAARARTPYTTNYDVHSATWTDGKPAHPLKCNWGH